MSRNFFVIKIAFCLFSIISTEVYSAEEWSIVKSRHFIVYHQNVNERFLRKVVDTAERYYYQITESFAFRREKFWLWEERAKIYIYKNKEDFQKAKNRPSWTGGEADISRKIIYTFEWKSSFFDSLLPHELSHIIFREFIGLDKKIPSWFEEGIASYQEKRKSFFYRILKKALKEKKILSIQQLSEINISEVKDKTAANLFYAEGLSIIDFLMREYGKFKFRNLCRQLRQGRSFEDALRRVYPYFKKIDDLNNRWIKYLKKKYGRI